MAKTNKIIGNIYTRNIYVSIVTQEKDKDNGNQIIPMGLHNLRLLAYQRRR
jgi:hypothetical protein